MVVSRSFKVALFFAAAGLVLPVAILLADRMTNGGWWPHWVMYVWPVSYMLGATSGVVDGFWYEIAAISISINVAIYAVVGGILARLFGGNRIV